MLPLTANTLHLTKHCITTQLTLSLLSCSWVCLVSVICDTTPSATVTAACLRLRCLLCGDIHLLKRHWSIFSYLCFLSLFQKVPLVVTNLGMAEQQGYRTVSGSCVSSGFVRAVRQHRYSTQLTYPYRSLSSRAGITACVSYSQVPLLMHPAHFMPCNYQPWQATQELVEPRALQREQPQTWHQVLS